MAEQFRYEGGVSIRIVDGVAGPSVADGVDAGLRRQPQLGLEPIELMPEIIGVPGLAVRFDENMAGLALADDSFEDFAICRRQIERTVFHVRRVAGFVEHLEDAGLKVAVLDQHTA